jgi:hypothetical protein
VILAEEAQHSGSILACCGKPEEKSELKPYSRKQLQVMIIYIPRILYPPVLTHDTEDTMYEIQYSTWGDTSASRALKRIYSSCLLSSCPLLFLATDLNHSAAKHDAFAIQ